MNNEQVKNLALDLANADREKEVVGILERAGLWNNKEVWKEFSNTGTIGGQQGEPSNALIEKLVNSIDAVFIKKCWEKRINPESKDAPQTIKDAQKDLFGIYDGNLRNLTSREISQLAKNNICFVSTGLAKRPSYTIVDTGVGQSPSDFEETFLLKSMESEKVRIPFVQGKFGMGSSGVIHFCSEEHKLQLIISKRYPNAPNNSKDKHLWGITVTRFEEGDPQSKNCIYTYLAPNGTVFSFDADGLDLLPQDENRDIAYGRSMNYGTFVKVYEYDTDHKDTLRDLWRRFEILYPSIPLPVRMCERRKQNMPKRNQSGSDKKGAEKNLQSFISKSLDSNNSRTELEEANGHYYQENHFFAGGQKLDYKFFVLKKEGRKGKNKIGEGVIFTRNGQFHASLPRRFFKNLDFGYIDQSLYVFVSLDHLNKRSFEFIIRTSRDGLKENALSKKIKGALKNIIGDSKFLRTIEERRWNEHAHKKDATNEKEAIDIFAEISKNHPEIFKMLAEGKDISSSTSREDDTSFVGSMNPTYFKAKKESTRENPKQFPKNNKRIRIEYKTDAHDNYFGGEGNEYTAYVDDEKASDAQCSINSGTATLSISFLNHLTIGKEFKVTLEIKNEWQTSFVIESFFQITKEREKDDNEPKKSKSLPRPIEVREERDKDWTGLIWTDNGIDMKNSSALKVIQTKGHHEFYINMDNKYLKLKRKKMLKTPDDTLKKLLEYRFKWGMVMLGLAILTGKDRNKGNQKTDEISSEEVTPEDKVAEFTEFIAPLLIPTIDHLVKKDAKSFENQKGNDDE